MRKPGEGQQLLQEEEGCVGVNAVRLRLCWTRERPAIGNIAKVGQPELSPQPTIAVLCERGVSAGPVVCLYSEERDRPGVSRDLAAIVNARFDPPGTAQSRNRV